MITCKPGTDCTNCPKRYEIETERGVEQRCEDADILCYMQNSQKKTSEMQEVSQS